MWDPAEHGLAGVTLAEALRRGDLLGFLLGINGQVLWPFVHALMLAPWLLVQGIDYTAAARLSSVLFAGTVVALCMAGLQLHSARGVWVGTAAAALALLSPLYRFFGTVCMLEIPGGFLLALTAGLHIRACREPAPRPLLVAAGVSTSALFLCKYNYGMLWLISLMIFEWRSLTDGQRGAMTGRLRAFVKERRWLRPFPLLMLALLAAIAAIQVTGGGIITLPGARISARSSGNLAYALFLLMIGRGAWRVWGGGGFAAAGSRLSERHRILIGTVLLPLAVWFLIPYPNRVRALVGFVVNRDSGHPLWSIETLLYYPRAFANEYSPNPFVGWIVLGLAALSPIRRGKGRDPGTLVALAFWVGLLATATHHYLQPRFLFTTVPLVWLLAASRAVALLEWAIDAERLPGWIREPIWAGAWVALLSAALLAAPSAETTLAAHRAFNTPAGVAPVVDQVLDQARRLETRPWLLGHWNGMSPALVRWQALLARPRLPATQIPEPVPWLPADTPESTLVARIEALRRAGRPVIAATSDASLAGATGEYWEETRADRRIRARLSGDPRVRTEAEAILTTSGFRVTTFRFAAPPLVEPLRR